MKKKEGPSPQVGDLATLRSSGWTILVRVERLEFTRRHGQPRAMVRQVLPLGPSYPDKLKLRSVHLGALTVLENEPPAWPSLERSEPPMASEPSEPIVDPGPSQEVVEPVAHKAQPEAPSGGYIIVPLRGPM